VDVRGVVVGQQRGGVQLDLGGDASGCVKVRLLALFAALTARLSISV
jgi:hypothetical protein